MNTFKQNTFFLEKVNNKDIFAVRSSLVNMIQKFSGKQELILEAIEYAEKNNSFTWDQYDNMATNIEFKSVIEEFSYEKEKLVNNFCKERFSKVLELYKICYKDKINVSSNSERRSNFDKKEEANIQFYEKDSILKKIIKIFR